MRIDIPTVIFLDMMNAALAAAVLWTTSRGKDAAGMTEARWAMVSLLPAFALQLARGHGSEVLVVVGANTLFWLTSALIASSYARFAGAARAPRWPFLYVSFASVTFAGLWLLEAPYGVRSCVTSWHIAFLLTHALRYLVVDGGLRREPSRRVAVTLILLVALPMWARIIVLLPQLGVEVDPLKPSLETVLGFVPAVLLVQGFALSFLLMQRERGEALARLQAITDPLTSCLNRRALEERVRSELAYQSRSRRDFAVFVVDLDHFKRINDEHGHAAGDSVLVHTASLLQKLVRPSDVVARYGGEEFCLLLRDTDAAAAGMVAERVGAALRADGIPVADAERLSVTASIGIAVATDGETWESLFRRADEALYRAKREGRDRFVFADAVTTTARRFEAKPAALSKSSALHSDGSSIRQH
ncbi:MAG: diguanylate cyclase [Myxococcota bacterium]